MTTTYIADIDLKGSEMERPFMRIYVEGESEQDALDAAGRATDGDEVVRSVEPLQPILENVLARIEQGVRYQMLWKHEGTEGPVWLIDLDVNPDGPQARPFGSADPDGTTTLPWMRKSDARRLAKYLGLTLEVS